MRLYPLFLYENKQIGSDALGNPIYDLVVIGESEGRFSSWSAEEIALDVRSLTVSNRKIVTRANISELKKAQKIKFEGLYHNITEIIGDDTTRWRIVLVNRYGREQP